MKHFAEYFHRETASKSPRSGPRLLMNVIFRVMTVRTFHWEACRDLCSRLGSDLVVLAGFVKGPCPELCPKYVIFVTLLRVKFLCCVSDLFSNIGKDQIILWLRAWFHLQFLSVDDPFPRKFVDS